MWVEKTFHVFILEINFFLKTFLGENLDFLSDILRYYWKKITRGVVSQVSESRTQISISHESIYFFFLSTSYIYDIYTSLFYEYNN